MPLRDHFRPPLADRRSWEGFHGGWPTMIVIGLEPETAAALRRRAAGPPGLVHRDRRGDLRGGRAGFPGGRRGGTTAAGSRPRSGRRRGRRWPSRPTCRTWTSTRCASTTPGRAAGSWPPSRSSARPTRTGPSTAAPSSPSAPPCSRTASASRSSTWSRPATSNLYGDLLDLLGQADPSLAEEPSPLYAVACRWARRGDAWLLETWTHPLALGRPLPTLPLWLAEDLAVPLELEASYEETCRILRIP